MNDAYTVSTLVRGDWDRADWQPIEWLPFSEGWRGQPSTVLSAWFDVVDPEPGTYRCSTPWGAWDELAWHGRRAAA